MRARASAQAHGQAHGQAHAHGAGRPDRLGRPIRTASTRRWPLPPPLLLLLVASLLVVGLAAVVLVHGATRTPATAPSGDAAPPNVKGRSDAPVEIEEWGDFQ